MFKQFVLGAGFGAAATGVFVARRWSSSWGIVPGDQTRPLPGDDVVPDGTTLLTRSITVDAPPDRVWPWLAQMGYGRAGWYSYDVIDMRGKSALSIRPELGSLEVGDVMPTHPGGGFVVKHIEPDRALVVGLDGATAVRQAELAKAPISAGDTPGLAASDRFLRTATPPDFAVSWAFVLERTPSGATTLVERFRGRFGEATLGSRALMPLLGFGVLVMMRKQMLGIRARAERAPTSRDVASPAGRDTESDSVADGEPGDGDPGRHPVAA